MEHTDVAALVDHLFKTRRHPDGREYMYQEVEDGTMRGITASNLRKLRDGENRNPGRDTLSALCRFFAVPPSYFFPELHDHSRNEPPDDPVGQAQIALRSLGLQPDVEDPLAALVRALAATKDVAS